MKSLIALTFAAAAVLAGARATTADLKVTHRSLVPLCFNSTPAKGERHWKVGADPVTLAFTMRNEPRTPHQDSDVSAGVAVIGFQPEIGHTYEVEVRADATAFSRRVYPKGEWMPVVRDRTTDRIVSGPPEWRAADCDATRLFPSR